MSHNNNNKNNNHHRNISDRANSFVRRISVKNPFKKYI